MGSAVSLLAGMALTAAVFLLLPEYQVRLHPEQRPLLLALAWSSALTFVSAAAFFGELRGRSWRRWAELALFVVLTGMCWHYWPR